MKAITRNSRNRAVLAPSPAAAAAAGAALLLASLGAFAQTGDPGATDDTGQGARRADRSSPAAGKEGAGKESGGNKESVTIEAARPWLFNRNTRYAHSLPEVDGPTITVTKKTSVVKLDEQPKIIDNNQRELFDRLPGIVLAEQQNPTQLNLNYRGLGNPQESEYVLVMQDGLPLELDWIGYPTLYNLPVPQTIGSVQMIRGGSGLLYGPEPQPVINFVSRPPDARPIAGTVELVGGSDNMLSSFNRVSGTDGRWDYLADFSRRQSDGQRVNGDYALDSADVELGYRIDNHQHLSFAAHAYSLQSGLAGLMQAGLFYATPNLTTTPDDRLWTDRYTGVLTYDNRLDDRDEFVQKVWSGYTDLITRADAYTSSFAASTCSATSFCATLAEQRFHYTGLDGRFVHRWARGNALTVGYTAYTSRSPYMQEKSTDPRVPRDDDSGRLSYFDQRSTRYGALFAENVFRFPGFHVVTSARFEHERLSTDELVVSRANPQPVNQAYTKNVPLFGIGIGNDFGRGNESYLNISQGYRPLRYLDIASPNTNLAPTNDPNPTKYLTYEAGVHGWPLLGFYYDVSVFQVNVKNRIESQPCAPTPGVCDASVNAEILGDVIDLNTGDTRSRGVEAETSYDLLRLWDGPESMHLSVFVNGSYLNARFTASNISGQVGKVPAYSPTYVAKGGITLRRDGAYKLSVVVDSVGRQYFQDSDLPIGTTPAQIPGYTVADLGGEYAVAGQLRLLGGISNLTDRIYYSRVFIARGIVEPGRDRNFYAGIAYDF
jgi:Fe(3+) dicitrate transport protein